MKLSFDPINGYRVNLPGDQTGEYLRQGDALAFAEWAAEYYIRMHVFWCHKFVDQRNPDNWQTTEQVFEDWKNHRP